VKAKVIEKFIDKETGKLREVGDEFTCTKKRFAEILSVGNFVEEIKETKAE
jgi:hypothetical protein